ncbi:MAG: chemotaxis protein CheD [Proteobacteria bacterium]|nr:chemotaxis protein CheD [Pseudomonadota bacterium]MBU1387197.1 chemotaxis protein CheD [Pseudomonadota bacterium]MBU1541485.1 chemotaxis protein CheD [Pseudomonadota bacterium]MBU2431544.1 chemotaxis protein CheD [Pseudomonadota bacterium]MBU2480398.1 chemotaxis protein CheD [Pseudomonadota bacterium]
MKQIVGVADMKVSNNPAESIITYSLGSCIGLVIYDPVVKVGGMLHYMLPESSIDKEKAAARPYMFADSGIPRLFKTAYSMGAVKQRLKIYAAGGAEILDQKGFFNIGKRNYMALKKMFFKNNVIIDKQDIGGNINRTVRLEIATGDIYVKTSGLGEVKI